MALVVGGIPNAVPYAPTLVSPANAATIDLSTPPTFQFVFSTGVPGQTMSGWAFRRKLSTSSTYQYWNAATGSWSGQGAVYSNGTPLPSSIAIDSSGNAYVGNANLGTITKITPTGTATTFASGFVSVGTLIFDSSGNLYAADVSGNLVYKITPGGVMTIFTSSVTAPSAMAFDASGNLYVANGTAGTITKVTTGGSSSTFVSGMNGPVALAFDSSGNLYVANGIGNTVSKVTSGGTATTFLSGLNYPSSLAFDASGNLYVANSGSTQVLKVTSGGSSSTYATITGGPSQIIVDSTGHLFVLSTSSGCVYKITSGAVATYVSGLQSPAQIALDSSGNLFSTNTYAASVVETPAVSSVIWNATSYLTTTSGVSSYTFPSGAWADSPSGPAVWNWSVMTNDAAGSGPWAPDDYFTAEAIPTLTVSLSSTATAQPTISWTPKLVPTTSQASYRAIIYTLAQTTAGGFTPGVTSGVYDSGVVGSSTVYSTTLNTTSVYLQAGTQYVAYVQIVSSGGLASTWTTYAWTTSFTAPQIPSLTVTATTDSTTNAPVTQVVVSGNDSGGLVGNTYAVVTYSDDGGTTWWPVRGGVYTALPASNQTITLYDAEHAPGYPRQFRAIVVATVGGMVVASAIATSTVTATSSLRWWFKDPLNPSMNMAVSLAPGTFSRSSTERQNVVPIMGRPDPVVLSDSFGLPVISFTLIFLTNASFQAFEQLRASQHTLLLQGPYPMGQYYVRLGDTKNDETNLPSLRGWSSNGDIVNTVTISAQAVAAP